MTKRKFTKAQKAIILGVVIGLALILVIALRGWWRGTFIPKATTYLYLPEVSRQFDAEFSNVNIEFNKLGINFTEQSYNYKACSSERYHFVSHTITCSRDQANNRRPNTVQHVTNWEQNADQFEKYLSDNDWEKQRWSSQIALRQLYDGTAGDQLQQITYKKQHGSTSCTITIHPSFNDTIPSTIARENCRREINIFGGSSY